MSILTVKQNTEIHRIVFKAASNRDSDASKRQTGAVELGDETQTDTDDGWPRGHSH